LRLVFLAAIFEEEANGKESKTLSSKGLLLKGKILFVSENSTAYM
jgi:hypothetical protein